MSKHSVNYYIPGAIVDDNTDLQTIDLPTPGEITLTEVTVNSLDNATGAATIEVRNQAAGAGSGGDAIVVTFSADENFQSNTGTVTTADKFYIRNLSSNGLYGINVTLNFTRT